jgi:hypothetical protein
MLRRYPQTLRWRQFIPPFFVLTLLVLFFLSLLFVLARWALALVIVLYLGLLLATGWQIARRRGRLACLLGAPLAMITMHFSWGTAFLWSLLKP